MLAEMKGESILITPETDEERKYVEKLGDEGVRVHWTVGGTLGICSPKRAGMDAFYFDSDEKTLIAFSLGRTYDWQKIIKRIETGDGQKTLSGLLSKILKFYYTVEQAEPTPEERANMKEVEEATYLLAPDLGLTVSDKARKLDLFGDKTA